MNRPWARGRKHKILIKGDKYRNNIFDWLCFFGESYMTELHSKATYEDPSIHN